MAKPKLTESDYISRIESAITGKAIFLGWVEPFKGAKTRALLRCLIDGHEWSLSADNIHRNPVSCKACAGLFVSESEYITRITSIMDGKAEFLGWAEPFSGVKTKARLRCLVDGCEWTPSINKITDGNGCPKCGKIKASLARRGSEDDYINRIKVGVIGRAEFLGWAEPFKGNSTKAKLRCLTDGHEYSQRIYAVLGGCGCPKCAGQEVGEGDYISRIESIISGKAEFLGWAEPFKGNETRVNLRCLVDGHEWSPTINKILHGRGCPSCGREAAKQARMRDESEVVSMIRASMGDLLRPVGWYGEYKGRKTKAVLECLLCGGVWAAASSSIIAGRGCPSCARSGFDPNKNGTLYALRSKCGSMVKIGISNKPEQRHKQLTRATPFDWDCVDLVQLDDGAAIARMEKELHQKMERIQFDEPFDGSTEWMRWDERVPKWFSDYRSQM